MMTKKKVLKPKPARKSKSLPKARRKKKPRELTAIVQQPVGQIRRTSPSPMKKRTALPLPRNYPKVLGELKERIRTAQLKASLSLNRELIALYRDIGRKLAEQDKTSGWGDNVAERLADDLRQAFPEMKGFSRTNLFYMRQFYLAYQESDELVQQLVGQIPWGHNMLILSKIKDPDERQFYVHKAIENGWSRNVLLHQIEADLYQRQGGAITNFERTLPRPQSELAAQTLKDPYLFDFLNLGEEALERDIERSLIEHLRDFLVELV